MGAVFGCGFLGAALGVRFLRPLGGRKPPPLKTAHKYCPYIKLLIDLPDPFSTLPYCSLILFSSIIMAQDLIFIAWPSMVDGLSDRQNFFVIFSLSNCHFCFDIQPWWLGGGAFAS